MHSSAQPAEQSQQIIGPISSTSASSFSSSSASPLPFPPPHHHLHHSPPFRKNLPSAASAESAAGEDGGGGEGGTQLSVILTVRMLMQGKEVGSIIGKRGDYVRQIREQSGAKINISDGSCPERIVTISGPSAAIDKAFTMVAKKFEEDMEALQCSGPKPPITLRLLVPASQCGSLIGKGGAKIRDIRDKTGASLQVASEMLSNSTEKPVTISGNSEALIGCMKEVCQILLDAPAKGPTIQYKPANQSYNPLIIANSAAAIAAAAAAQKGQQHLEMPAGIAFPPMGAFPHHHQQQAILSAGAMNPLMSLQEQIALLQQHGFLNPNSLQPPPHPPNVPLLSFDPSPALSRFLLPPNGTNVAQLGTVPVSSTAAALSIPPNILPNNSAPFLANHLLLNTVPTPSTAAAGTQLQQKNTANLEQFYGALDASTLAALFAQHQQGGGGGGGGGMGAIDAAAAVAQQQAMLQLQQQQQIQMFYQQQQQQVGGGRGAEESQLITGRTIGNGGKAVKECSSGQSQQQQKRFTPY